LIEVDSGSFRSDRLNQVETIAKELRHEYVFESKYSTSSVAHKLPILNKQCNAFLTNNNIVSERFHYLNNGVKRLVIEVELEDCSIFLVHLSLKFRHRQYQLQELYSLIKDVRKPVIVAGDFNVFWGDRELQLFLAATGLKSANSNGEPSHPSRSPRRQLDFILHSPEIRVSGFSIPQVKLSDHAPLICDFEVMHNGLHTLNGVKRWEKAIGGIHGLHGLTQFQG
jgi:endonuclease/exonuclease/phosphatase family metal-dependent hydrolase